ncbi:GTP-binding protein GTR1 [Sporothrix brasiliensis 5110]|uniref:GTP-binding protein n=1 Tax=Sporothrix brasiliensis 5110 TaxID=1398154 RepID=A0A0C2FIY0_9PEZI|nr:GTP-binding protein GTR1 [Sporothrix brasiliensis 5110]KIH91098.1 GTP-binding protein GTR1 [Sporothrix brasiliensis 5110]
MADSIPFFGADVRSEVKKPKKRKVLLMGKSGSGKSSMRSIIFSSYLARDTRRLGATIDIDLSQVKFLGNLTLNLWDCGGQEAFTENYLSQQRQHVFSNVGVLIYVFDIESRDVERDLATYVSVISALTQYSSGAKVFVLIHKMDLIVAASREAVFEERVRLVRQKTAEYLQNVRDNARGEVLSDGGSAVEGGGGGDASMGGEYDDLPDLELTPFATSIWDQSLYKAWASIIHDLVPNLALIETNLGHLGRLLEAEEMLLFERTSFLVVSHWTSAEGASNPCEDRFERMSNILKSFKSSLARYTGTPRNAEQFKLFELRFGVRFNLFIGKFTTNTYILVVLPPGEARFNAALLNTQIAAKQFEFLDVPVGVTTNKEQQQQQQQSQPNQPGQQQQQQQQQQQYGGNGSSAVYA